VFRRWMVTRPPAFVWRLAVQFECYRIGGGATGSGNAATTGGGKLLAATQHTASHDRVRVLLKDLVMKHNVAASWGFYAGIELHALHDADRAVEVLQTALKALPNAQSETSLHLLLAESLSARGESSAARKTLVELLEHCTRDAACLPEVRETVFNSLAAFERSASAAASGASSSSSAERAAQEDALINAQVRMRYRFLMEQRQQQRHTGAATQMNEGVLDAFASLAALEMSAGAAPPSALPSAAEEVLRSGVVTAQLSNDVEIQQHASLAMALARCMSQRATIYHDDKTRTDAKDMLLKQLQAFPHGRLRNPALWTEACRAILACEAPDAIDVVRKVLGQALGACPDDELFRFYVWLEVEYICGSDSLNRAREIYKAWLDRFPLRSSTWSSFALFEFQHHEIDRADGIFKMGIQLLSQRAKEAKIVSEAYEHLDQVDALWKDRLRCSMKRGSSGGSRDDAATHTASVYEELLQASLGQYFDSFDAWRITAEDSAQKKAAALEQQQQKTGGHHHQRNVADSADSSNTPAAPEARRFIPPPPAAGAEVQPMIRRLAAALSGRIGFERRRDPHNGMDVLRGVFKHVVQTRRGDLQQRIAADAEFQRVMHERQWLELSLSPVFHLWRQMEAEFGTPESLSAVAEVAEPPKKKARLFKSSKA
jgi:tetratricopeptide (TPR) repeat protein